jgi:hypothetical protein
MILILVGLLFLVSTSKSAQTLQTPKYDLELSFEPGAEKFSGRAIVQYPPSAVNDGRVSFKITYRWPGVSIGRITGDSGHELEYDIRDTNKRLEVELGEAQEKVIVEYSFHVDETSLKPYGYYKQISQSVLNIHPRFLF